MGRKEEAGSGNGRIPERRNTRSDYREYEADGELIRVLCLKGKISDSIISDR
jgi:hypothetical protein